MFLAVCKNNLVTCVKRHISSFANVCVVAARLSAAPSSNVWRCAFTARSYKTSKFSKTEKFRERLKTTLCSSGNWPNQERVSSGELHRCKLTSGLKRQGLLKSHLSQHLSLNIRATKQDSCSVQKIIDSCSIAESGWRNKRRSPKPLALLSTCRGTSVSSCVPQGYRGYSSSGSGHTKSQGNGICSDQTASKDCVVPQQSKSLSAGEELSNFKELYENPWTIPNFLCMARIGLAPVLGYLIVEKCFNLSLGLFVLVGATDLLDGYIARNWANQKSALGSALDPLADKILISVLYVSLTYASLIPVPLTILVITRDVALIAAVFYVRYKTVPPPRTLSKYFNPCYATAQLKPTLISKVNTAVQLVLVAASLAAPVFRYTDSLVLQALWCLTTITTVASGYSYYHYGKKTVEVLNKSN